MTRGGPSITTTGAAAATAIAIATTSLARPSTPLFFFACGMEPVTAVSAHALPATSYRRPVRYRKLRSTQGGERGEQALCLDSLPSLLRALLGLARRKEPTLYITRYATAAVSKGRQKQREKNKRG